MANEEQLEILTQGTSVWNKWREQQEIDDDHQDIDLSGVVLSAIDMAGAN